MHHSDRGRLSAMLAAMQAEQERRRAAASATVANATRRPAKARQAPVDIDRLRAWDSTAAAVGVAARPFDAAWSMLRPDMPAPTQPVLLVDIVIDGEARRQQRAGALPSSAAEERNTSETAAAKELRRVLRDFRPPKSPTRRTDSRAKFLGLPPSAREAVTAIFAAPKKSKSSGRRRSNSIRRSIVMSHFSASSMDQSAGGMRARLKLQALDIFIARAMKQQYGTGTDDGNNEALSFARLEQALAQGDPVAVDRDVAAALVELMDWAHRGGPGLRSKIMAQGQAVDVAAQARQRRGRRSSSSGGDARMYRLDRVMYVALRHGGKELLSSIARVHALDRRGMLGRRILSKIRRTLRVPLLVAAARHRLRREAGGGNTTGLACMAPHLLRRVLAFAVGSWPLLVPLALHLSSAHDGSGSGSGSRSPRNARLRDMSAVLRHLPPGTHPMVAISPGMKVRTSGESSTAGAFHFLVSGMRAWKQTQEELLRHPILLALLAGTQAVVDAIAGADVATSPLLRIACRDIPEMGIRASKWRYRDYATAQGGAVTVLNLVKLLSYSLGRRKIPVPPSFKSPDKLRNLPRRVVLFGEVVACLCRRAFEEADHSGGEKDGGGLDAGESSQREEESEAEALAALRIAFAGLESVAGKTAPLASLVERVKEDIFAVLETKSLLPTNLCSMLNNNSTGGGGARHVQKKSNRQFTLSAFLKKCCAGDVDVDRRRNDGDAGAERGGGGGGRRTRDHGGGRPGPRLPSGLVAWLEEARHFEDEVLRPALASASKTWRLLLQLHGLGAASSGRIHVGLLGPLEVARAANDGLGAFQASLKEYALSRNEDFRAFRTWRATQQRRARASVAVDINAQVAAAARARQERLAAGGGGGAAA